MDTATEAMGALKQLQNLLDWAVVCDWTEHQIGSSVSL